jgi:hypothetical protein
MQHPAQLETLLDDNYSTSCANCQHAIQAVATEQQHWAVLHTHCWQQASQERQPWLLAAAAAALSIKQNWRQGQACPRAAA